MLCINRCLGYPLTEVDRGVECVNPGPSSIWLQAAMFDLFMRSVYYQSVVFISGSI